MSIFNRMDVTDITAIYAALISTVTLIWTIINAILEKLTRIKVHVGISATFEFVPGTEVGPVSYIIGIKIINKSAYDIYINKPKIKLPGKVDGHHIYQVTSFDDPVKYPLTIKPREQHEAQIKIGKNLITLLKKCKRQSGKIRIIIEDTIGKKFYSNRIPIKKLIEYGEMKTMI